MDRNERSSGPEIFQYQRVALQGAGVEREIGRDVGQGDDSFAGDGWDVGEAAVAGDRFVCAGRFSARGVE